MGMVVIPLLLMTLVPARPQAAKLADFSRLSKAINAEVAIIDPAGIIREGRLIAATRDEATIEVGTRGRSFPRADVAVVERIRDGRRDGLIKGMVFGAITGVFAVQGLSSPSEAVAAWFGSVAFYGGIGWALDAAQNHRETIYRAPVPDVGPKKPSLQLSVRF